MTDKTVLAVDPGSAKCGLALVRRHADGRLELEWRRVVPNDQLPEALREAASVRPFELVIVGSGTRSRQTIQVIKDVFPSTALLVVDERDTSMAARERYWEHTVRRGWRRLFPSTMLTPPEPVDDFAALILAERVLEHG